MNVRKKALEAMQKKEEEWKRTDRSLVGSSYEELEALGEATTKTTAASVDSISEEDNSTEELPSKRRKTVHLAIVAEDKEKMVKYTAKDIQEKVTFKLTDGVSHNFGIEEMVALELGTDHIPDHLLCHTHPVLMFNHFVMGRTISQSACGASFGNVTITDLDYADDVAILAEIMQALHLALHIMDSETRPLGLQISWQKTKSNTVEVVDKFTYLGSTISSDFRSTSEIKNPYRPLVRSNDQSRPNLV
ncbi:hypothetical protein Bbelb_025290 [Branchiostoma belcheri]|nr:hypothetical protein Bbelb_025290 [Branchiostoma belcheri]